jgi:hypothetical protein
MALLTSKKITYRGCAEIFPHTEHRIGLTGVGAGAVGGVGPNSVSYRARVVGSLRTA